MQLFSRNSAEASKKLEKKSEIKNLFCIVHLE